jgi:hypothetical protein
MVDVKMIDLKTNFENDREFESPGFMPENSENIEPKNLISVISPKSENGRKRVLKEPKQTENTTKKVKTDQKILDAIPARTSVRLQKKALKVCKNQNFHCS